MDIYTTQLKILSQRNLKSMETCEKLQGYSLVVIKLLNGQQVWHNNQVG